MAENAAELRTVPTVHLGQYNAEQYTGLTYRQLDYAVRRGFLKPLYGVGSGSNREWTHAELRVARTFGRLTAIGLTMEAAHRIARCSDARQEIAPGITIEVTT
jgi:DNA-binding transcriptional MerR regulator